MKKIPRDILIWHMWTINHNHTMHGSWDMKCVVNRILSFWTVFLPFYPFNPKNQNFEKMKKKPGGIIILHISNINENNMVYGSWDIEHDRRNFLSFWIILCTFIPLTFQTPGDIIILHKCTKNHHHMLYCSLDMADNRFNCYFSFWAIFYTFTPLTA